MGQKYEKMENFITFAIHNRDINNKKMKKVNILPILAIAFMALCGLVSCEKDPITEGGDIEVYVDRLEAKPEGEELRFNFSIVAPIEGVELGVECDADWVSNIRATDNFVLLDVAKNSSGQERSAELQLSYGAVRKSITVVQKPFLEPLSLTIESVDATSVTISVTTLDEQTTWIGQIVGREWFEAYDEEQIFNEDYAYYSSKASEAEISIEEYLEAILSRGSHSGIRMSGLDVESEYVVYIYGMNTLGEKTTSLYYEAFTTTPPYAGNDVTFDIDVELNRALASITIVPSHEGVAYYHNITTREHFEQCGSDIDALAQDVVATALDNYLYWEYTEEEFFKYNTSYLTDKYDFEAIADTEYVVFAFKWDENLKPLSEISYEWFKVDNIPPSDNRLAMTITNITQTTFDIDVTTTNNDPYTIFAVPASEIAKMTADSQIFKHLIDNYGTSELAANQCEGPVQGTFSGLEQDTEYVVLLFGYEAGVCTTDMVREKIHTAMAGDIEACQYSVEVTEIGDREAHVSITPTDYSVWFYWNVFEESTTEEQIKEYIANLYNSYYYADYWEFSYYEVTQGDVSSYISQLRPSTPYKVVVLPMDPNKFEYTGTLRSVGEFTTEDAVIADINIKAGFDAYYDGDEVCALEPGSFLSFKGYAIIPMSVTIEGEYSRFLYTIFDYVDGLEEPSQYSDDVLLESLYEVGAYWTPAYFRGEWDKDLMIAAVAFDMEGNPSRVYRERFKLNREGASPAQEFVDYYMSSSSVSAQSLSGSMCNDTIEAPELSSRVERVGSEHKMRFSTR